MIGAVTAPLNKFNFKLFKINRISIDNFIGTGFGYTEENHLKYDDLTPLPCPAA